MYHVVGKYRMPPPLPLLPGTEETPIEYREKLRRYRQEMLAERAKQFKLAQAERRKQGGFLASLQVSFHFHHRNC